MKKSELEKNEARETLSYLKPGDTVSTVLRSVSRSGMSRQIGVVTGGGDSMSFPNWATARLIGATLNKSGDGVKMGGCGMDMGFALVYELSSALFPDGFGCIGEKCPSCDHSNGDRDYTPHDAHPQVCTDNPDSCTGNKHWHKSGGYALRHRWI